MGLLLEKKALFIIVIVLLSIFLSFYFFSNSTENTLVKLEPKPGKCFILEEKFCYSGELVKEGSTTYMGFNLPSGTPVYSRTRGDLEKTKDVKAPFSGYRAVVRDEIGGTTYRGNLQFDNLFSKEVQQGELIGRITQGNKILGYNLLVTINKRSTDGPIVDEESLRSLFKE